MKPARLPFALSGGALSQRRKLLWIAILALSPLAYFGATALESRLPQAPRPAEVTRDAAVERAVAFARTLDIDAHDWTSRPNATSHDTVTNLFRKMRVPALDDVVAPSTIFVRMTGPKPDQWMSVDLTPSGRVIGYSGPKPRDGGPVDEGRDRDTARQFLVRLLAPDHPFELGEATVAKTDKQAREREFVWEAKIPGLPQGKLAFHVKTANGRVVSERRSVELDPAFEESLATHKASKTPLVIVEVIYFIGRIIRPAVSLEGVPRLDAL